MKKTRLALAIGTIAMAASVTPAAIAKGTPQRSNATPPGLQKVFERMTPGIVNAIMRTEGSNSRLQDLPTSP